MQVKKVTLDDLETTYCCMNEVPPSVSWPEYLPESRQWFRANLGKHVEGYHLLDGVKVVGHVYFATSEKALIPFEIEPEVACIYCTEILRDYMHRGYGKMMFDYMKNDLRKEGFKGILIPATEFKEWMHYELFLRHGFKVIKEHSPYKVMYFPLTQESISVKVVKLNYTPSKDKVEVTLFKNHFFCPVGAYMYYLIKKVARSFGDKVKIVEIDTTPETLRKYGTQDPLINGKIKIFGPASEEEVKKAIQEELG
ncbi:MAG: GNAT family N-acetyltransferase [Candidatus Bathyarchaeota archaeon]|nr:GNAT family N-acetyltransferase [Candidatus Bathyarchaeota archaeon]